MSQTELYQSVLKKLGDLPAEYLIQIDDFLSQLSKKAQKQTHQRDKTMALAGSWKDLSEEDFQDYLKHARESGSESFGREVDL